VCQEEINLHDVEEEQEKEQETSKEEDIYTRKQSQ